MPELNIVRGYEDGEALLEADLDNIKTAVTTLNNNTKYDGDNIQSNAITLAKIIDGSVPSALLGAGSITSNKVADSGITTSKIADGEVETRAIADSAVTTAKIADANVTTTKFSTSSRLDASKISSKSTFISSASGNISLSLVDPETEIATVTASATTRVCLMILQPAVTAGGIGLIGSSEINTNFEGVLRFKINGVTVATRRFGGGHSSNLGIRMTLPISCFNVITNATIVNGSIISVTADISSINAIGTCTLNIDSCKLYVIEL